MLLPSVGDTDPVGGEGLGVSLPHKCPLQGESKAGVGVQDEEDLWAVWTQL